MKRIMSRLSIVFTATVIRFLEASRRRYWPDGAVRGTSLTKCGVPDWDHSVRIVAYGTQWFTKQTILLNQSLGRQPNGRPSDLHSVWNRQYPVRMALFGYHSSAPFLAPIRPLVPTHMIASRMALVSCFPLVIFI